VGLTRRTFERRFKAATGDTPNLYLQRVRVERAKKMLEEEEMTFEEISYYLAALSGKDIALKLYGKNIKKG
jgi:transcriptional regulator GlxA family with amidase domain